MFEQAPVLIPPGNAQGETPIKSVNREKIIGKNFHRSGEFAAIRLVYGKFLRLFMQCLTSL